MEYFGNVSKINTPRTIGILSNINIFFSSKEKSMRHILNDVRVLPSFPEHWPARVRICWLVAYLLMVQMVHHHHPTHPSKVGWSPLCMQCIPQISYDWPSEFKEKDLRTYGPTDGQYQICQISTLFPSSLKRYLSKLSRYFIKTPLKRSLCMCQSFSYRIQSIPLILLKHETFCNVWHWNDIRVETFIGL